MYSVGDNGELHPLTDPHWLRESIHVFDGEFTEEDDKLGLVDVVLGLWWRSLTLPEAEHTPSHEVLHELVAQERDSVFPAAYFALGEYSCVHIVEELAAQQTRRRSRKLQRSASSLLHQASEKLSAAMPTTPRAAPAGGLGTLRQRAQRLLGRGKAAPPTAPGSLSDKSIDLGALLHGKGWRLA